MKGHAIPYSGEEMGWLEANRALPIGDYQRGFYAAFGRLISKVNLNALRKRKGWKTGRTGQFVKGQEPCNKGRPCPPGRGGRHPNAQKTQFRKGSVPANAKPLGTERLSKDGYIEINVAQVNPYTGHARRYVQKHRHLWEAINGPVPKGHCLKSLDGDKANTDPSNWVAIPRGVAVRLNGGRHHRRVAYDDAAPELRPTLMAMAQLQHQAHSRQKPAGE